MSKLKLIKNNFSDNVYYHFTWNNIQELGNKCCYKNLLKYPYWILLPSIYCANLYTGQSQMTVPAIKKITIII